VNTMLAPVLVNWKEFGAWIHKKIDGDFSWKIRPIDTRKAKDRESFEEETDELNDLIANDDSPSRSRHTSSGKIA